jgi:hypothetical protein
MPTNGTVDSATAHRRGDAQNRIIEPLTDELRERRPAANLSVTVSAALSASFSSSASCECGVE